jgi:hypothetical protein
VTSRLFIYFIGRDWRKREWKKARRDNKVYPRWGEPFEVGVVDDKTVAKWLTDSATRWIAAKDLADDDLPDCPSEKLWGGSRCDEYCEVQQFCKQGKAVVAERAARPGRW